MRREKGSSVCSKFYSTIVFVVQHWHNLVQLLGLIWACFLVKFLWSCIWNFIFLFLRLMVDLLLVCNYVLTSSVLSLVQDLNIGGRAFLLLWTVCWLLMAVSLINIIVTVAHFWFWWQEACFLAEEAFGWMMAHFVAYLLKLFNLFRLLIWVDATLFFSCAGVQHVEDLFELDGLLRDDGYFRWWF